MTACSGYTRQNRRHQNVAGEAAGVNAHMRTKPARTKKNETPVNPDPTTSRKSIAVLSQVVLAVQEFLDAIGWPSSTR